MTLKLNGKFLVYVALTMAPSLFCHANDGEEGRWDKPGIPHKGWVHKDVTDLGEPNGVCDMCNKTDIRYLHTVSHEEYDDLQVGCVCAEKMSEDYVTPRKREQEVKNIARRKRQAELRAQRAREEEIYRQERLMATRQNNWLNIETWNKSERGNYFKRLPTGQNITIFQKYGNWSYVCNDKFSGRFSTMQEAISASFDDYKGIILHFY